MEEEGKGKEIVLEVDGMQERLGHGFEKGKEDSLKTTSLEM